MDRREALRVLGGAVAAASVGAPSLESVIARPRPGTPLGVQLYTLRDDMARSVERTLERVGAIGYQEVEFHQYFGRSPKQIRSALDAAGLSAPSTHVALELLDDAWPSTLEAAAETGHRHVVVPWIPPEMRRSLDDYRVLADRFNRAGERARKVGLQFGFHNHDFVHWPQEGTTPYDLLLETCDAQLVAMQMDVFWAVAGGADPLTYFARHPGRFHSLHLKDRDATGGMVDVGKGTIDFAAILDRRAAAGVAHLFVEHDEPTDAYASIAASRRHLETLQP